VVQAVGETFRRFADDVSVPASPDLVQTPVIWHLGTPISGSLRPGVSPLELVYALHPTPAVGGWPLETARQAIAELEDFDRGFYAGLLGWMDGQGRGEWVLVLRGGIVAGATATVYAGAGIVANSDPEKEHAETATKLRTFINALA
jgi:isochorismate synthase